ncbi:MAG: hypothetical protein CMH60_06530 [Myxococcales bacterium]|nr:hypothetical protein [Myxococcales bacterium]
MRLSPVGPAITEPSLAFAPPRIGSSGLAFKKSSPTAALSADRIEALPKFAAEAPAKALALYKAMKGGGCDRDTVFEILENTSPQERDAIENAFNQRHAQKWGSLRRALCRELKKSHYRRAMSALNNGRSAYAPDFATPAFERLIDEQTNSVTLQGNRVTPLFDGPQAFSARNKLIDEAQHSIYLQTFIFTDDGTGWDLAKRLVAKAREGVEVKVIYDGLGSLRTDDRLFKYMKKNGVQVREYGKPLEFWDWNDRWHEKIMVTDSTRAIVGGMNIADEYATGSSIQPLLALARRGPEAWRDTDMLVEGPSAQLALQGFASNWRDLRGKFSADETRRLFVEAPRYEDNASVRFVQHRPEDDGDDNTSRLLIHAINTATESVILENAYFVPPKRLREALMNAARRGVKVKILTNGKESSDVRMVTSAGRFHYDDLLEAGVEIYEYKGSTLHSKTALFDDKYSIIGSMNLNGRSKHCDSESLFATNDKNNAIALKQRFNEGLESAEQVTMKGLENDTFLQRLSQFFWRLFSPSL